MDIHLLFAKPFLLFLLLQSQGAITERLRSFSMHDLTAIQGDEPVGQRHYQTLPDTRKRGKNSTNESLGLYLIKQNLPLILCYMTFYRHQEVSYVGAGNLLLYA